MTIKAKTGAGLLALAENWIFVPPINANSYIKINKGDAVIDSIMKDRPLNVMYWAVRDDGNFEVIDGQQRTISICEYVNGDFSFNKISFDNLQKNQREQILNYELMVYQCQRHG